MKKTIEMNKLFFEINNFIEKISSNHDIYGESKWFINDYIQIYLRVFNKGWIPFGSKDPFLIIATVSVNKYHRRQGIFRSLVCYLETINPFHYIGVESVSNDSNEMRYFLKKENFSNIDGKHFYKRQDFNK